MKWLKNILGFEQPPKNVEDNPHRALSSTPTASAPLGTSRDPMRRVVAIDCETTGLSPIRGDRIVTFAAIELTSEGKLGDQALHLVFNPERKSHPRAAQVHGYRSSLLALQDHFSDHAFEIRNFIGDALIVGHNVTFDIGFLNSEFLLCSLPPLENEWVCTMHMWRAAKPGHKSSLDAVTDLLGISDQIERTKHDALQDAYLSLAIYKYLKLGDERVTIIRKSSTPDNLKKPEPTQNQNARHITVEQAVEAYERLGTYKAAAHELGVSPPTIRNRLKECRK